MDVSYFFPFVKQKNIFLIFDEDKKS